MTRETPDVKLCPPHTCTHQCTAISHEHGHTHWNVSVLKDECISGMFLFKEMNGQF